MSDEDQAVDQQEVEGQEELSEEDKQMAELKEAISVEQEEIGSLRLKLTVTVPQDTLDSRRGEQFSELKRDSTVPGFRKGHAPLRLVEKRFASDVGQQLRSQLISSGYLAAVEKQELKPLGDPLFWVKVKEERIDEDGKPKKVETEKLVAIDEAIENITMPKEGPLVFSCELELKPEFELPKLGKIPVTKATLTVSDDDVESELNRLRMQRGTFQPVAGGKIKADDMLYADMKMSVDGEVFASEENFDLAARDLRIKGVPLIGFSKAVVGGKTGDTVTFEAPVPDDHDTIEIRGKTASFEFIIHEIKRLELPPLDKEFLSSLGFESEDELRKLVRSSLDARLDSVLARAMRDQVSEYLLEETKLEIPAGLSQRQTDRSIARRMIEMYQAGVAQAEIEKNMDELRTKAHDRVVRDLKLFFILEKIAEDRNIEVGEEQINGAIADIAQRANKRFDRVRDELSKSDGLMTLYLQIRDGKVLDDLLGDAEMTEAQSPKKKTVAKKTKKKEADSAPVAKKKTVKKAAKKSANKKSSKG